MPPRRTTPPAPARAPPPHRARKVTRPRRTRRFPCNLNAFYHFIKTGQGDHPEALSVRASASLPPTRPTFRHAPPILTLFPWSDAPPPSRLLHAQVLEIGIEDRDPCASDVLIGAVKCSAKRVYGPAPHQPLAAPPARAGVHGTRESTTSPLPSLAPPPPIPPPHRRGRGAACLVRTQRSVL